MKLWERYFTPRTVEEASDLLARHAGTARVVAGGTDLLLEIRQGRRPPVTALVDITHIPELACITQVGETIVIGAGVTHAQIVCCDLLAAHATCLVESCGVIGGPQVRNVATLGGNVVHALPAADGTTSLVALDASADILQGGQRRQVPILDMFRGPGDSLIDPTQDILLGFQLRLGGAYEGSSFKRIMRPQGVALPVLGCAVWVKLADDCQVVEDVRVCISPIGPTPARAESVENALRGCPYTDDLLAEAISIARRDLHPRASKYRATAEYRIEMIEVLLRRVLPLAVHRAQTGEAVPEGVGM